MKFKVSAKKEDIKDGGAGGFINRSGIFDVKINFVQVATSSGGAKQLNFNVTHNGMEQVIYGPYITNKKGEINEITMGLLNKLCVIAGLDDGHEIETEEVTKFLGKDKKKTDIEVIPELSDIDVKMRIQMSYDKYKGDIKESRDIKSFFTPEGASAQELQSGEDIGKRLALETEKYLNNVTYSDEVTEEEVKAWLEAKRKTNADKADTPTDKSTENARKSVFAQD